MEMTEPIHGCCALLVCMAGAHGWYTRLVCMAVVHSCCAWLVGAVMYFLKHPTRHIPTGVLRSSGTVIRVSGGNLHALAHSSFSHDSLR